jgi:hypothetical protein
VLKGLPQSSTTALPSRRAQQDIADAFRAREITFRARADALQDIGIGFRARGDALQDIRPLGRARRTSSNEMNRSPVMSDPTRQAIEAALQKWAPLALQAEEATSAIPFRVLTGEAVDLSYFLDHYWEPQVADQRPVPGLKQAPTPGLHQGLGQELRELQLAVAHQYARYLMAASSNLAAPVERGEFVLHELQTTLAYLFDDGVEDEADEQLRRFAEAHAHPTSQDALALALETYALFADSYRGRMKGLPEFDEGIVDEALVLAKRLREHSGQQLTRESLDTRRAAIALRNRLTTLLLDRMAIVRRAASYVFRNHPDIARKAMSSYDRTRRARSRREKAAGSGAEATQGGGTAVVA